MMSPDNIQAKPAASKEENQTSNNRKTAASTRPPQEQVLKCPRCDSPNTKFCYYNNYSLTQPRHFCKTCRRYWTKGGALRNVPIGGGCRKNKKIKSSSSRLSCDSRDSSGSSSDMISGLKFFHGLSPAMDFNLGGLSPFPRLNNNPSLSSGLYNQFSSFGDSFDPSGSSASPLSGFNHSNYPFPSVSSGFSGIAIQEMGSLNVNSSLASSIESLSSINQDLHWKLQQQRLAALFGGGDNTQKESSSVSSSIPLENNQAQNKPQPILFQNLEISKPQSTATGEPATTTEWFFGNSYAPVTANTPAHSTGTANDNTTTNWNGSVQTWSDLHQYSALP